MSYDRRYKQYQVERLKITGRIEGIIILFIGYLLLRYGIPELINLIP